jgi:hypothetical protein
MWQAISWASLAGTVTAPLLYWADRATLPQAKAAMVAAMIVWFVATPLWMGRAKKL